MTTSPTATTDRARPHACRRRAARRHGDPNSPRAGDDGAPRRTELVVAEMARPDPAGGEVQPLTPRRMRVCRRSMTLDLTDLLVIDAETHLIETGDLWTSRVRVGAAHVGCRGGAPATGGRRRATRSPGRSARPPASDSSSCSPPPVVLTVRSGLCPRLVWIVAVRRGHSEAGPDLIAPGSGRSGYHLRL